MTIETLVNIAVGFLTIITILSPWIFKIIRASIIEEVVQKDREMIKYINEMTSKRMKEYENKNEEIRQERQLRYGEQLSGIRSAMSNIELLLRTIESDMKQYGEMTKKHEWQIETFKEALDKKEDKK